MRFPSKMILLVWLVSIWGCSNDAADEQREFQKVESAIGMVANALPQDRGIRLEQLEAVSVKFDRIIKLKDLCVSSHKAFENAAQLLNNAKKKTDAAEAEVARADQKKSDGGTLSPSDEARIIEMGKGAAASLEAVTAELNSAEQLVAACQAERNRLRFQLASSH